MTRVQSKTNPSTDINNTYLECKVSVSNMKQFYFGVCVTTGSYYGLRSLTAHTSVTVAAIDGFVGRESRGSIDQPRVTVTSLWSEKMVLSRLQPKSEKSSVQPWDSSNDTRLLQPLKAEPLIEVILEWITMDVSPVHPLNALQPIEVTESGITMDVSPVHPSKALLPIDVTKPGITMDVSPIHPPKVLHPIDVTKSGMTMDVSPLHPWKAYSPIEVAEFGITMDVSPLQS
jgi:hypothetical protein